MLTQGMGAGLACTSEGSGVELGAGPGRLCSNFCYSFMLLFCSFLYPCFFFLYPFFLFFSKKGSLPMYKHKDDET